MKRTEDMTLADVLALNGMRYHKAHTDDQRNTVYDPDGVVIGNFDAFECWNYLRGKGLLPNAEVSQ